MTTSPAFIETSPSAIADELVYDFELATGKTLYPAQVERLLLDIMAYREALVRQGIQTTAEQNLVDFATGSRLEALGRLVGVASRLAATPASCTLRIEVPGVQSADIPLPIGWKAMGPDGVTAWALTEQVVLVAGQIFVDAKAQALTAGASQNDLPIGSKFTPLEGLYAVTSLTKTSGGSDQENDDQLRARALQAPYGFSVAGSRGAYRFHAMGAHPSILDVAVKTGAPGEVLVYPITTTGLPAQAVLDAVSAALASETVRPLCDLVTVAPPARIAYTLEANLTSYATADQAAVLKLAQDAAAAFVADRKAGLGRDLVASQVIKALSVDGVYKVELVAWADRILDVSEWADGTVLLHLTGTANG